MPAQPPTGISILGSTGSIGRQALEVVDHLAKRGMGILPMIPGHPSPRHDPHSTLIHGQDARATFRVVALAAQSNVDLLAEQALRFRPRMAVIGEGRLDRLTDRLAGSGIRAASGMEALVEAATLPEAGIVLAAISGAAGILPAYRAIQAGKRLAFANKEVLVAAGRPVMAAAASSGSEILPVDSEHSAIFQALIGQDRQALRRIILTASGGPFVELTPSELEQATASLALAHPTWQMGPKITIDSATLMNKGLEVIEAHWLFGLPLDRVEVVIHRQSIVHSMVEFCDRSVLAQMSVPDMRLPIQLAFTYPRRVEGLTPPLDLVKAGRLTFESPDTARFPCLELARRAASVGGTMPAVMNAANEVAVARFLAGESGFMEIPRLIERAMERHSPKMEPSLEEILTIDREVRAEIGL